MYLYITQTTYNYIPYNSPLCLCGYIIHIMQERESCHWITLKGIVLSCNHSEKDKPRSSPLDVESSKAELIETELPGAGGRGMRDGGQRAQISDIR